MKRERERERDIHTYINNEKLLNIFEIYGLKNV